MDLSHKVAIVTGGASGIGIGTGRALAENGASVILCDRNESHAEDAATLLQGENHPVTSLYVDVQNQSSITEMVQQVIKKFGTIDIVVNNAGVPGAPGWEKAFPARKEDWDFTFEINVRGVALVIEEVSLHMKEKKSGKIVNIASVAGRQGHPNFPHYSTSKAAVINLTQAYALGLAPYNINVNAICPGLVWTPLWESIGLRAKTVESQMSELSAREVFDTRVETLIPLKREQTPQDMGNTIAFLVSDLARNITGQAINVDGGLRMN